jgi:hypothetical protein
MRGPAIVALVEALLTRGRDRDLLEAEAAVDGLASVPTEPGFVLFDLPVLRLRAQVARARGDEVGYGEYRDRYAAMASSTEFRGHMALAAAMH